MSARSIAADTGSHSLGAPRPHSFSRVDQKLHDSSTYGSVIQQPMPRTWALPLPAASTTSSPPCEGREKRRLRTREVGLRCRAQRHRFCALVCVALACLRAYVRTHVPLSEPMCACLYVRVLSVSMCVVCLRMCLYVCDVCMRAICQCACALLVPENVSACMNIISIISTEKS